MPYWDHERGVEYISTPLSWSLFTPSHFVTAPVGHGERIPRTPSVASLLRLGLGESLFRSVHNHYK